MGLDFIPIGQEEYDFALPQNFLDMEHIQAFAATLKNPLFHEKLHALGGYTTEKCGEVVFLV